MSGYRGLLRFDGSEVDFGFELLLDSAGDSSELDPGTSGAVRISLWAAEELPPLVAGRRFELREAMRVVGKGVIAVPRDT